MYNNRERRKHKRIEKPYMARLRVKQYEGLEISSSEWDMVALKDLSAGGVLFNYNKNLGIGSLLDFKIDISRSTPTINCAGKVTRIEHPHPLSMFRIATEFAEIEEHKKEMINATLERISE
jgi:c-di-GMP-binding flagellar brake protein YcgR